MSVRVNASGEYLRRTANLPSSTAFTMCGWMRCTWRSNAWQYSGVEDAVSNSSAWMVIGFAQDVSKIFHINGSGGSENFASSPSDEAWFFWAITCSGNGAADFKGYWAYPSDASFKTATAPGVSFTTQLMSLGNDSYDEWMNAAFSHTLVFNVALSEAQLWNLMHFGDPQILENINIHSPHYPGTTERLLDLSGNGRNWTAGGTLTDEADPPLIFETETGFARISAGGTAYNQSVAGTLTSAGALARLIATSKTGMVTSAGAITKRDATAKTGSVTSSGTVIKQIAIARTGMLTSAGAFVKRAGKALSGTVASDGAIVKQMATGKSGATTSAGTLTKRTATAKVGTVSSSGALAAVRTILVALAGVLSSAGALTRQTQKGLSGAVSSSGATIKRIARSLSGTVSSSGALTSIKAFFVTLSGVLSPSGVLTRRIATAKTGALPSAGELVKQTRRALAGVVTASGALVRVRVVLVALTGVLSSAGTLARQTQKNLIGSVTSDGSLVKRTARALSGALDAIGDLLATLGVITRPGCLTVSHAEIATMTVSVASANTLSETVAAVTEMTVTVRACS